MERVLVTGATGMVGRQLIPLLAERFAVHAISTRAASADGDPRITWHTADLLDPAQTERVLAEVRPALLVHLAWVTEHGAYWTSTLNTEWVAASLHLYTRFAHYGGRRLVSAGTCAEYAWQGGVCDEAHTPLLAATPYGRAKAALSVLQGDVAARLADGAAWLRIFHIYGPGEHPRRLIPSVITALQHGETAKTTAGTQIRDLISTRDAAAAFAAVLASPVQGAINVGTGTPIRLHEAVSLVGSLLGRPDLIALGAIPIAPNDPPVLIPNVTRLFSEVGWRPAVSLADGLAEAAAWWAAQP